MTKTGTEPSILKHGTEQIRFLMTTTRDQKPIKIQRLKAGTELKFEKYNINKT
jgi:hypothetical protein